MAHWIIDSKTGKLICSKCQKEIIVYPISVCPECGATMLAACTKLRKEFYEKNINQVR